MVGQPQSSVWDKLQTKDAQLGILSMSLLVCVLDQHATFRSVHGADHSAIHCRFSKAQRYLSFCGFPEQDLGSRILQA